MTIEQSLGGALCRSVGSKETLDARGERARHCAARERVPLAACTAGRCKLSRKRDCAESEHMRSIGARATLTFFAGLARPASTTFRPTVASWLLRHASDQRLAWLPPEELALARQGFVGPVTRARLRRATPVARVHITVRRSSASGAQVRVRAPAHRRRLRHRRTRRPAARRAQSDSGGGDEGPPGTDAGGEPPSGVRRWEGAR